MDQTNILTRFVIRPTDAEDAAITAAALSDPDAKPLTDAELARMRPVTEDAGLMEILRKHGRPSLPETARKQRVTLYLDRKSVV